MAETQDYLVVEIQHNADGTASALVWPLDNDLDAEAKYHSVLAAAAKSALPRHAATMLAGDGSYVQHRCYEHGEA